jgi:hypothetical protein
MSSDEKNSQEATELELLEGVLPRGGLRVSCLSLGTVLCHAIKIATFLSSSLMLLIEHA